MKIAFVIHALDLGGAERVAANLANGLTRNGHQILILTYQPNVADHYQLEPAILRQFVDFTGSGLKKLGNLRRALSEFRPARVISFMSKTNIRTILAGMGKPWKTAATEHNYPPLQPMERRWEFMRNLAYRFAWKLVSVSSGVDSCFDYLSKNRRRVIPNAFPDHPYQKPRDKTYKTISAVGRLVPIKGFDLLIEAFRLLPKELLGWKLQIWGEGSEKNRLHGLVKKNELEGRVFLMGSTEDPIQEMAKTDFLVCASRSEGFGNVLIEAFSVGIPAISFDCPAGPRDIVQNGKNGWLVRDQDVAELSQSMARMMSNDDERRAMGEAAVESSKKYSMDSVLREWETLLQSSPESKKAPSEYLGKRISIV